MGSNYFSPSETKCKDGCGLDITPAMLAKANEIREAYGHEMIVNCGARCPTHNKSVGGAPKSSHVEGNAIDFKQTPKLLEYVLANLDKHNIWIEDPAATSTWIHIQIRPSPTRIFKP